MVLAAYSRIMLVIKIASGSTWVYPGVRAALIIRGDDAPRARIMAIK